MQSFVNQPFLDKRSKFAKWGSYLGFGALFLGLMTTSRSPLIAYLFLLVGLLGASFGSYMANRYVRQPRADQVFERAMEVLDKRYSLYNYFAPVTHLVTSHNGMIVLEPRAQEGEITYPDGRCRHKAGFRKVMQLFGEPSVGKPDQDLERQVAWVKEWIDEVLPEDDIPVHGAVVFTSPRLELHVGDESPISILAADDLARHLKEGFKGGVTLPTTKQKELGRIMDEVVAQG